MTARVNHRGWIVLISVASLDSGFCVDVFEDPAGGFGFAHFRSDPEDGGRWTLIDGSSVARFDDHASAASAAVAAVAWLAREPSATQALDEWVATFDAT